MNIHRDEVMTAYKDAAYWRRHYEVEYQQTKSETARRTGAYFEGLMRGYERVIYMADELERSQRLFNHVESLIANV